MLAAERRQRIVESLRHDGKVVVTELSGLLAVSADTIRRDLQELGDAGLLQRVHGGALPRSPGAAPYASRLRQDPAAKVAIARAAARRLRTGQVIVLNGGTTTLQVAEQLSPELRATVLTNSPPVAVTLVQHPGIEVTLIGGRLQKDGLVTVGAATVEALRSVRPDVCVLGVCSLHPQVGITETDAEEAHVKRAMIDSATEVVAVAAAEKLGTVSPYVVAPVTELTHLVTDATDEQVLAAYRQAGISVICAVGPRR
jgi:DeoR/GlpR family transcriptional regulator of sugar metabolism